MVNIQTHWANSSEIFACGVFRYAGHQMPVSLIRLILSCRILSDTYQSYMTHEKWRPIVMCNIISHSTWMISCKSQVGTFGVSSGPSFATTNVHAAHHTLGYCELHRADVHPSSRKGHLWYATWSAAVPKGYDQHHGNGEDVVQSLALAECSLPCF